MGDFNLKTVYDPLVQQYTLPLFEELDNHFEFKKTEETSYPLRYIRRRMVEKLSLLSWVLERVLYPNTQSVVNMHESSFFAEEEKRALFTLYQEIMVWHRESLLLDLESTDATDADFIHRFFSVYPDLKNRITIIAERLENVWKQGLTHDKHEAYFG